MLPTSDLNAGHVSKQPTTTLSSKYGGANEKPQSRRRLQLSCGECRKKKLSCDRNWPCQRCLRAGRPAQCTFESGNGQPPVPHSQFHQAQRSSNSEIQNLRAEIAQLKGLLTKAQPQQETDCPTKQACVSAHAALSPKPAMPAPEIKEDHSLSFPTPINALSYAPATRSELSDPRHRSPRGYYSQHTLFQFFIEVPQLFPFIKETVDERLTPLGVNLKKNKASNNDVLSSTQDESQLSRLLPSREDTDILVLYYLDHMEQLHRIVHIPMFQREYANFWAPEWKRHPAMEALVLAMMAISAFASVRFDNSRVVPAFYRTMPTHWVTACEEWLVQQSSKHRKLVHYQVSCLIYFAKRMNMIKKKRHWQETAFLFQNAIVDGLHREPSTTDGPYMREMKRRMWAVLRELELQNVFECGLPSLIHNIESNVVAPSNLDDEDFDNTSGELPKSRAPSVYTNTSYQVHSSQSWALRLAISKRLYSPGIHEPLTYNDVLQYTHELTKAIQRVPSWEIANTKDTNGRDRLQVMVYAFLHFQLKDCILAIHRPYIQQATNHSSNGGQYWLSESVCWTVSREILLMNSRLANLGIQSLTMLREDLLLACLNLTRITMLQSSNSPSIIMASSESVVEQLKQSLQYMKDRYLRSYYGEPWCFVTLCAALMLLRMHLGKETWESAKSSLAHAVLDLRYEQVGTKQVIGPGKQQSTPALGAISQVDIHPMQASTVFPESGWLDSTYPDLGIDPFDLDMDLDDMWKSG